VEDEVKQSFVRYPNPGKNELNRAIPAGVEEENYRIIDIQGRVVLEGTVEKSSAQIHTGGLYQGYYMIVLRGDFGRAVQAWVKSN